MKQHIFLGGTSYCGSTMMSLILGSLEGVGNISESNWLVPNPGQPDPNPEPWNQYDQMQQCRHCGPACPLWTQSFRQQLQQDPTHWHHKIADRLGVDILVSAEKSPKFAQLLDPKLQHTAVILYRHPLAFWRSVQRRPNQQREMQDTMTWWISLYSAFLDRYNPTGGKIFVSIEHFLAAPLLHWHTLTQQLQLPFDASALEYWKKPQHYIGGNFNVNDRLRDGGLEAVQLRPASFYDPTPEEIHVLQSSGALELYTKILARCPLIRHAA